MLDSGGNVTNIGGTSSHYTLHNDLPLVETYNNMLTNEECQHFIDISKDHLQRALVSENNGGVVSNGRTGSNTWILHDHDEITFNVANRISKIVNIPLENAEKFQIIYYGVNEEYRKHYDGWDHNGSEKTLRCIKYGGQRIKTALCYLNDVVKGGGTRMTKLEKTIEAEKGKLLIFDNTYKDSNIKHPLSEHAGLPVEEGEKFAFNLWFRECSRSKLYREFNPNYYIDIDQKNGKEDTSMIVTGKSNDFKYNEIRLHDKYDIYSKEGFLSNNTHDNLLFLTNTSETERRNRWVKLSEVNDLKIQLEKLLSIDSRFWENINVVEYKANETHCQHHIAYDLQSENGKKFTSKLGQRLYTVTFALSDNISVEFPKLGLNHTMKNGEALFYKNVRDNTNVRELNVERIIKNNSNTPGYIANVYIREKSKSGLLLYDNLEQSSVRKTNNEDFTNTLDNVLQMFRDNKVQDKWSGLDSFTYTFKGDFKTFKDYILRYSDLHYNNECINYEHLDNDYNLDPNLPLQIVNNVITANYKELLQEYYKETISKNVWQLGDKQSNRFKSHNEPMSRFLHYELLPLVEKIVNKRLRPTYTYLSAYVKDADLPAHTDRPDCEYTVSFIVDKPENSSWNIYVHKVKQPIKHKGRYDFTPPLDECEAVDCDAGGLMLFQGTDHIHFREKLPYDYYNILLLHYCSV